VSERLLLLDIGNSRGKWLLLDGARQVNRGSAELSTLADAVGSDIHGAQVLVASVASDARNTELAERLYALDCRVWFAGARAGLAGLTNSYAEPERMGVDRWLAMLAARKRSARRICVVDAGSALTIDLVSEDGEHEGGFIIPGTELMLRALFADTDRVRFDAPVSPAILPGRSTAEAVANGLLLAQVGALRLALDLEPATQSDADADAARGSRPRLYLCGGAAATLQAALDMDCVLAPDLVLEGLLIQAYAEAVLPEGHSASLKPE
jgi:type III pantothenate kinase